MTAPRNSDRQAPAMLTGSALALGLVALAAEIVLFAAVGQLAHHHAGGGTRGLVVAALALVLTAVLWAVFMAPTSARRLATAPRAVVCAGLGVVLGVLLLLAGWTMWGVVVGVAGLVLAAVQWTMGRAADQAAAARTDCVPPPPEGP